MDAILSRLSLPLFALWALFIGSIVLSWVGSAFHRSEARYTTGGVSMQEESKRSLHFSSWLRHALVDAGLSQRTLSRRIHISPQAITKWMRGDSKPKGEHLFAIADALGVDIAVLRQALTDVAEPNATAVVHRDHAPVVQDVRDHRYAPGPQQADILAALERRISTLEQCVLKLMGGANDPKGGGGA